MGWRHLSLVRRHHSLHLRDVPAPGNRVQRTCSLTRYINISLHYSSLDCGLVNLITRLHTAGSLRGLASLVGPLELHQPQLGRVSWQLHLSLRGWLRM